MNWFEKIKRYYDKGIYSEEQVRLFVTSGKITEEEYLLIVNGDKPETLKKTRKRTTKKDI